MRKMFLWTKDQRNVGKNIYIKKYWELFVSRVGFLMVTTRVTILEYQAEVDCKRRKEEVKVVGDKEIEI